MTRVDNITWNFKYKGREFENRLKESWHGDFYFQQNGNSLFMGQCGERYFLPILIYGMEKIKSSEQAKKDLEKKEWIKGLDFKIESSNSGPFQYFQLIFTLFNEFKKYSVTEHSSRKKIIKIDKELKIFYNNEEIMILPYHQLSLTIDKLLLIPEGTLFRTSKEDYSRLIKYYVSGEFEEYYKKISEKSNTSSI